MSKRLPAPYEQPYCYEAYEYWCLSVGKVPMTREEYTEYGKRLLANQSTAPYQAELEMSA